MAQMTQEQIDNEIRRKASQGIAVTDAKNQTRYNELRSGYDKEIARKAGAGEALTNTGSQYNNDMYARLVAAQKPADTGEGGYDGPYADYIGGGGGGGGGSSNAQNYIDQLNNAKQQAIFSQLDKSRQGALSGLQNERSGIQPKYYDQRNQVAAGSQQSARSLAEFMANRGGVKSGANAQAEISRQGVQQGNLGTLGRQEAQAYTDIERRTSDLNSAYESDRASAVSGIEADRMSSLLSQFNTDRNYNLNLGSQLGMINGQQTLGGRSLGLQEQNQNFNQGMQTQQFGLQSQNQNFQQNMQTKQLERSNFESDRSFEMAKGQQAWEQAFQQGQFDFNKGQAAFENAFKNKSFQQSVNEASASRGLQWASLNQRDKEFVAQEAWNKEQFEYTKEQDTIDNNIAANKPADYKFDTDPVFIGAISDAGRGGLTSAQIANDAESIIADITYSGYQKLLSAAKVYEASKPILSR